MDAFRKKPQKGLRAGLYIIIGALICLGLAFFAWPDSGMAAADPLAQHRAEQKRLKAEMDAQKKEIAQKNAAKKDIQAEINDLDLDIHRLEADMESANIQLQVLQTQLGEIENQLKDAEARLEQRLLFLKERILEIYINGDVNLYDVLFDSEDYSDFLMRYDMLEIIVQQDLVLLEEVKADRALIEEQKALKEKRFNDLVELRQIKANSISELSGLQEQKAVALDKIDKEKAAAEAAFAAMEAASKDVEAQIRKIQEASKDKGEFNGIFKWPLPGHTRITSDYGMRFHPILKQNKLHTGVDIGAPKGTSIVAVEKGTVIFSGWNSAYGQMVIVDHGGGVSTLYAHMSKILAANGKKVSQGETIGQVGSTGWSTGNHLHFEVRINGSPVNPWTYLK